MSVHAITHDDEGFAWISTFEGLIRDDGHQITLLRNDFRKPDVLANNIITQVVDGHCGLLWVGTGKGLYSISKNEGYAIHRYSCCESLQNHLISALCVMRDSTIWATGGGVLVHIGRQGELLDSLRLTWDGNGEKWVNDMAVDAQNRLWVAQCGGGLSVLEDEKLRILPWTLPHEPNALEVSDGGVWVGTWGGGVVWHDGTGITSLGNSFGHVIDIALGTDGHTLWLTSMQGLEAFDVTRKEHAVRMDLSSLELPEKSILDKLETDRRSGCIWVASMEPCPFAIVEEDRQPEVEQTLPIGAGNARQSGKWLYVWGNRMMMSVYDTERNEFIECRNPEFLQGGSDVLAPDGHGGCWSGRISADGKNSIISFWWVDHQKEVHIDDVVMVPGVCKALSYAGNTLWMGTMEGKLFRWDGTRLRMMATLPSIKYISAIGDDVYAGTSDGVYAVTPKGETRMLLPDANVTCMTADKDSGIWIGTTDGRVYRKHGNGRMEQDVAAWPMKYALTNIVVDAVGHLWLQSSAWLREYNPTTGVGRIFHASEWGGVCFNNICKVGNRVLACGGGCSFFLSPTTDLGMEAGDLHPRVSSIEIDGNSRMASLGETAVEVVAGVNAVSLTLTTLNALVAPYVSYAYRLVPHGEVNEDNTDWVSLQQGQSSIHFTQLSQGLWDVQVVVTDRLGRKSRSTVVMTINRLPAWWETWWAISLYVLFVAVAAIYAQRLWNYVRRLQKLYAEAVERRKNLMLQSVEVNSRPKDVSEADDMISRCIELIEQHLDDSDYSVEQMAADMCMSRMTLYRKMQLHVRQSPADFIRSIRLKNAAALLRSQPGIPVAEVADRVGFVSSSSFRQQFKKMFGVPPSEYK